MQEENQRPTFARFMASLAQKSEDSHPTLFHQLLKALDDRGTLVRIYTQNIDGLERKTGISTHHRSSTRAGDDLQHSRCVPLHGSLQYMYCQSCHAVQEMKPHWNELMKGRFPSCTGCQSEEDARREAGKRIRSVPTMVPDVVLYGQEHPDSQVIAEFEMQDLSLTRVVDLLIVVGTGMDVIGTQRIIREFAEEVRKRNQNKTPADPSPCVIYLNLEFKQQKRWESVFDVWIQADCQTVATVLLGALKEEVGKAERRASLLDLHEVEFPEMQHECNPELKSIYPIACGGICA